MWKLCRSIVTCSGPSLFSPVICIIHAVDKCASPITRFLQNVTSLAAITESNVKFVVTSRTEKHLSSPWNTIKLYDQLKDREVINRLINSEVANLVRKRPIFSIARAREVLVKDLQRYSPNFSHIAIRVKFLETVKVNSSLKSIRSEVLQLPRSLSEIVGKTLIRVRKSSHFWVRNALDWILYSFRPLAVDEFAIALALEADNSSFSTIADSIPQDIVRDLMDEFGGLVQIENGEVRLFHRSVSELHNCHGGLDEEMRKKKVNLHLGLCCISYMSMAVMEKEKPLCEGEKDAKDKELSKLLGSGRHSLLVYAVQYWHKHIIRAGPIAKAISYVIGFLENEAAVRMWNKLYWSTGSLFTRLNVCTDSPLAVASQLGILEAVKKLLSTKNTRETKSDDRGLAVELAAENGHFEVV